MSRESPSHRTGRLIAALQEAQRAGGYLSREAMLRIAQESGVEAARVWGVATFFDQFRFHPPGRHAVRVCCGTACHLKGSEILLDEWRRRLGIDSGQTTTDREFSLDRVACVGCCTLAPVVLDGQAIHAKADPTTVQGIILKAELEAKDGRGPTTGLGAGPTAPATVDRPSTGSGRSRPSTAVRGGPAPDHQPPATLRPAQGGASHEPVPATGPLSYLAALRARADAAWGALWDGTTPTVWVGTATCGKAAGADKVLEAFRRVAGSSVPALTTHDSRLTTPPPTPPWHVLEVGCLGHCYAEPLAIVRHPAWPPLVFGHLSAASAESIATRLLAGEEPPFELVLGALEPNELLPVMDDLPRYAGERRWLLRRAGRIVPADVEQYVRHDGYAGLAKALTVPPDDVIAEVRRAGLRGLGGGGFGAARKWEECRKAPGDERYVIANGDEGDPGAFMDRTLMESDPHAILEGMAIVGHAVGARRGYVYVRAEYPLAVRTMTEAVRNARAAGVLGDGMMGTAIPFDVEICQGAGAFVCGESSALMASLEGRRGYPRVRPPHSTEQGLWSRPTVLNNVKTLAATARILERGAGEFAAVGTARSKGTAVFALAGKIVNPGLIEVPMGTTLRRVVHELGGGVPGGKALRAVQIGGPSGGCLPASALDTPVDFDSLAGAGAMMGSGGLVVLDEDDCLVESARYFMEFARGESCGKCTFCREGTHRLLELLTRITCGAGIPGDLRELEDLAKSVAEGSACNLGKTAPRPVLTTLRHFREEYEEHILEKRCRAKVCRPLISYRIDLTKCARGCDACVGSCPTEAITTDPRTRKKVIDPALCVKCRSCARVCPAEYDAVVISSPAEPGTPPERSCS
ncbi:MAG: NAD(P)H-dependent oxidoreductase subunit E [Deltaproteobacteria bacterium]|nr:NAD(P)H-dependent oxidoreductase subunit E [Deltaproteobacteria bacterium]